MLADVKRIARNMSALICDVLGLILCMFIKNTKADYDDYVVKWAILYGMQT